nr:hypothetical protein [Longispora sp. (in: high G+C Gram-positive bacteria)]
MTAPTIRTYGNFKNARRQLIGSLGPMGVGAATIALVAAFFAMVTAGLGAGLVVGGIGTLIVVPMAVQIDGYTVAERILRRLLFARGQSKRQTIYRSGIISPLPGSHRLPGLMWKSRVMDVETGRADWPTVGVVVYPGSPRTFAVTLRCDNSGTDLVDPETVDMWVANTGAWLQALGAEPDLLQAQVTTETTPDPGTALARTVNAQIHPDAPALAKEVLTEIVDTYPQAAASSDTRVTLVFAAPRPRRPRTGGPARRVSDEEMCQRIAGRLAGLAQRLRGTGAGEVMPLSAADLAMVCRAAYDPAAASDLSRVRTSAAVSWADCGPVTAEEHWDYYRHDSGVSVSWGLAAVPRGVLHSTVLPRMMAADLGVLRKRVTITYRPLSPAQTAHAVDTDVRDSQFRLGQRARPTARDMAAVAAAKATAIEEASGAGLVRFSLLFTATVGCVDDLDLA